MSELSSIIVESYSSILSSSGQFSAESKFKKESVHEGNGCPVIDEHMWISRLLANMWGHNVWSSRFLQSLALLVRPNCTIIS